MPPVCALYKIMLAVCQIKGIWGLPPPDYVEMWRFVFFSRSCMWDNIGKAWVSAVQDRSAGRCRAHSTQRVP